MVGQVEGKALVGVNELGGCLFRLRITNKEEKRWRFLTCNSC